MEGDEEEEEEEDHLVAKEAVATRLNQLLSSGPMLPPGRRVLRTQEDLQDSLEPVPLLIHPNDAGYTRYGGEIFDFLFIALS